MADRFLVDTCVFVRWYIEQDGYQDALSLQSAYLAGGVELETVDFVRYELGDVLRRKGLLLKKIMPSDYVAAVRSLDDLEIPVHVTTADVSRKLPTSPLIAWSRSSTRCCSRGRWNLASPS
ncbi:MAG: hypothetical protein ACR2GH_16065 [Pseudonocardia sp.]